MKRDPTAYQFSRGYTKLVESLKKNRRLRKAGFPPRGDGAGGVVSGTQRVPVFLGKFDNSPTAANMPFPVADLQRQLFDGPWPTGTMTEYYAEISYGNLQLDGTVFDWVTTSQNDTYYAGTCNGLTPSSDRTDEFITEILTANDGAVDFSQFDNDGADGMPNSGDDDGFVDFVAIVHPEMGGECVIGTTPCASSGNGNIWSHRSTLAAWGGGAFTTNDARSGGGFIRIDDYTIMPGVACGGGMIEIGVFCHEFGHAFGLPDLYDTNDGSEGLGNWCLMASGNFNSPQHPAHMSAWAKAELGWITPAVVASDLINWPILSASVTPTAFQLWTNGTPGSEYFLVENRTRDGFDDQLPAEGLLIYHVDENVISANVAGNTVNADETRKGVDLECEDQSGSDHAVDTDDLDAENNRGDTGDPFCAQDFAGTTMPSSVAYSGTGTGVEVRNISGCGNREVVVDLIVGMTGAGVNLCMRDCGGDTCTEPSNPPCSKWWASQEVFIDNNGDGIIDPPAEGLTNKLKARVRNAGTSNASSVDVDFYLADPSLGLLFPSTGTLIDTDNVPLIASGTSELAEVDWFIPIPPPSINHWCVGVIATNSLDAQSDMSAPRDNNLAQINIQELYAKAGDAVPVALLPEGGAGGPAPIQFFDDEKIFQLCNPFEELEGIFGVRFGSPPDFDDLELPDGWFIENQEEIEAEFSQILLQPKECVELRLLVRKVAPVHMDRAVIPMTLLENLEEPVGGAIIEYNIDNVDPLPPCDFQATLEVRPNNKPGDRAVRISWNDSFSDRLGFPERSERWRIFRGESEEFLCNDETLLMETAIDEDTTTACYDHFSAAPPSADTWYKIIAVDRAGNASEACITKLVLPVAEPVFVRGEANADGTLNVSDGVSILSWLFEGNRAPTCLDAADTDDSGDVNLVDAVSIFEFLFLGTQPPPDPGPHSCGRDPTPDELDCAEYNNC